MIIDVNMTFGNGNGRERTDMNISELLKPEAIVTHAQVRSKEAVLDTLVDLHDGAGNLTDRAAFKRDVLAREAECVTAIGYGIAIPHAKSAAVRTPGLAAITVPEGVQCSALDGKPSHLFFMIAAPEDGDLHLEILSCVVNLLMDESRRNRLLEAETPAAFLEELRSAEQETA